MPFPNQPGDRFSQAGGGVDVEFARHPHDGVARVSVVVTVTVRS